MKLMIFIPLLSFLPSEKHFNITGVVQDSSANPIEHAFVSLATERGIQVKTIFTDIKSKLYTIDTVQVIANFIRYGADSYTIFMQNNPENKGKNVIEALRFLPYVTQYSGSLQILGQNVNRIRINGVAISDMKELETIQAENLDKVEVVFINRLDEFDSGSGGEINITLNKSFAGGYYGSVSAKTSTSFKYGNSGDNFNSSLSYGNNKLSIYNYINFENNNENIEDKYITHYKKVDKYRNSNTESHSTITLFADRLSINYDLNKSHIIGLNMRYSRNKYSPQYSSLSRLSDHFSETVSGSFNSGNKLNNQYQGSVYYTCKLGNQGSAFKLTGDYLRYQTDTKTDYEYFYNAQQIDLRSNYAKEQINNRVNMYLAKASFNIKTGEKSELELGTNYNSNRTNQILKYSNINQISWIVNNDMSDNYKLSGDNYAGFASFSSGIGSQINYKISTRLEYRDMGYHSIKINQENKKSFNNIGVLIDLIYHINKEKGDIFNFYYQRFWDPVPYSAISPVVTYINEYSYTKGNLELDPLILNEWWAILSLRNKWEFALRIYATEGDFFYKTFVDKQNPLMTYTMPVNGKSTLGIRMTSDCTFKIANWWKLSAFGLVEWYKLNSTETISKSFVSILSIDNSIEFKKNTGGMINLYWKSGSTKLERNYGQETNITMSVYKYFFDNKLQIKLEGTLYKLEKWMTSSTNEIYTKHYPNTDHTKLSIGATYNFKRGKKVKVKQHDELQNYNEITDE